MLSGATRVFGVALIAFYLLGSRATKCAFLNLHLISLIHQAKPDGKQRKEKLEEGEAEGYRTGWQVLSNSAAAAVCGVAWNYLYFDAPPMCSVDPSQGYSRALVFGALGHFACCLGDTLASELGILSAGKPRLVTTWRPVPPGTNGGMSVGGTIASVVGGATMGVVMGVVVALEGCSWAVLPQMVLWGALGGGAGSLADSILGATIQETRYSEERKMIMHHDGNAINGWNILTNNQVNVVSSVLTAMCMSLV